MQKKLFLLCGLLFVAHFSFAQHPLYVITKSGELKECSVAKVFFDEDMFDFENKEVTDVTKESISASFSVAFQPDGIKTFGWTPEVGICFSDTTSNPTINDRIQSLGSSFGSYDFRIVGLDGGTDYFYRAYAKVNDVVYYGDVCRETTLGKKTEFKYVNGHKFIDLGLPSGLLWSVVNIGAETATDDGEYFAWGETMAKSDYSWDSYKYGTSDNDQTKYNKTDGKSVLDSDDDAATSLWGEGCRIPTAAEFEELCDTANCTWTWIDKVSLTSSVGGYKITSKTNFNSIFLPASGFYIEDSLNKHGSDGYYWTNTLNSLSIVGFAKNFNINSRKTGIDRSFRRLGYTIRPVAKP